MSTLSRHSLAFTVASIALLVAACGLPGKTKSTQKQVFSLQAEQTSHDSGSPGQWPCLSLRISPPESAPGLNTTRMAYRVEPGRVDYFAYHEWVAPPARMVASLMEARLDESGLLGPVVSGSSDIRTDYRLDSTVLALQQDFDAMASAVSFSVKVNLIDLPGRSLVTSETYSYVVPADGRNAESGVAAANRAVARFLDDLVGLVAAALASRECAR